MVPELEDVEPLIAEATAKDIEAELDGEGPLLPTQGFDFKIDPAVQIAQLQGEVGRLASELLNWKVVAHQERQKLIAAEVELGRCRLELNAVTKKKGTPRPAARKKTGGK